MKRVFTSLDQVMHLWANQSQSDARCSNVFFNGVKIYSYGTHYELGRLVEFKGHRIALINDTGYSVTTSKHISQARSAASHLIVLNTLDLDKNLTVKELVFGALLREQDGLMNDLFDHFKGLSFRYFFVFGEWDQERVSEFNNKCKVLGFDKLILDLNPEYIELYNEHIQYRIKRSEALQSPEELAKKAKRLESKARLELEKKAAEIEAWKIGGPLTNAVRALHPQIIRIMTRIDIEGADVQTSRGATVPFSEAKRLLERILNKEAEQGEKIGSFTFNEANAGIVCIGCHNISLEQAKLTFERIGA